MNTLGNDTQTQVTLEESYALAIGFPAASDLVKGQMVKLKNDGTVEKLSAKTDRPFGLVVKGAATGERATVLTTFMARVNARAKVDLDEADVVSVDSYNTTDKVDVYDKSVTGDFASGIVLTGGLANSTVEIGILRTPFKF